MCRCVCLCFRYICCCIVHFSFFASNCICIECIVSSPHCPHITFTSNCARSFGQQWLQRTHTHTLAYHVVHSQLTRDNWFVSSDENFINHEIKYEKLKIHQTRSVSINLAHERRAESKGWRPGMLINGIASNNNSHSYPQNSLPTRLCCWCGLSWTTTTSTLHMLPMKYSLQQWPQFYLFVWLCQPISLYKIKYRNKCLILFCICPPLNDGTGVCALAFCTASMAGTGYRDDPSPSRCWRHVFLHWPVCRVACTLCRLSHHTAQSSHQFHAHK